MTDEQRTAMIEKAREKFGEEGARLQADWLTKTEQERDEIHREGMRTLVGAIWPGLRRLPEPLSTPKA